MKQSIKAMDKTIDVRIVIGSVAALLVLCFIAFMFVTGSRESSVSSNGKSVDVDSLVSAPGEYKGYTTSFVGKVFVAEGSNGSYALQVYSDIKNSDGNIIVYTQGKEKYKEGDYVRVTGTIGNVHKGENAFGATLIVPVLEAKSVSIVDADQAIAPTQSTKNLNQTKTIGSLTVTLEKIEYAENESRVYLNFNNAGPSDYTFYSFNANLVQSQQKIKELSDYSRTITSPDSDLLAGTKESAKMYYEKLDPKAPSTFSFEVTNSSDYTTTLVKFDIN